MMKTTEKKPVMLSKELVEMIEAYTTPAGISVGGFIEFIMEHTCEQTTAYKPGELTGLPDLLLYCFDFTEEERERLIPILQAVTDRLYRKQARRKTRQKVTA